MRRAFQLLRRRRRLLLRPLVQNTLLRLYFALAIHPDPYPQLPGHRNFRPTSDTPGLAGLDERRSATLSPTPQRSVST
jgi:hypothetical protein